MSVKSFHLVSQLPGDQLEAVREYKHTRTQALPGPELSKHDTSEDAKPTQREYEKPWDLLFLPFDIIARVTPYVCIPVICFFYDFTCCSQKNIHSSGLWKSILLEIQGIGILFNSTSADKEKAQLGQLIAEKEHSKCVYLKDCCRKQNCHVTIEYNIIQF